MTTIPLLLCLGALIASLNPCTVSVVTMAMSSLLGKKKHPRHASAYLALFTLGVFVSYAVIGTVLTLLFRQLPIGLVGFMAIGIALLLIVFGIFEIKDYFWYGKGWSFKLTARSESRIHAWTKKHHERYKGFLLGVYTALKLSHYTAIMVVAFSLLFVLTSSNDLLLSSIWAMWYSLPLLLLSLLVASGMGVHSLMIWKEESKHVMRLSVGMLYVLLGWILLVYLAGGLHLA